MLKNIAHCFGFALIVRFYNPFSHLVYAAKGNDVTHVIINGRLVMEERKLLTLDLEEITAAAKDKAEQVKRWVLPSKAGTESG